MQAKLDLTQKKQLELTVLNKYKYNLTLLTMAHCHTNKKGQQYFLHGKKVTLRGGRQQQIYYFAREHRKVEALDSIPQGYKVVENERTGLPLLKKA